MNNDLFKAGVSRRGFLTGSAALCAMAGLGLAGCGGSGAESGSAAASGQDVEYRDELQIALPASPDGLDPHTQLQARFYVRQIANAISPSNFPFTNPEVLILDEPTRGIDVGAKFEIYSIINQLAAEGKGILMISSEMPELLGTCDRIYVMNEGRIVAELSKAEASQESIMRAIMRSGEKH